MSPTKEKTPRIARTRISCHPEAAQEVFVAGSFNDWDARATPMERGPDGDWEVALELPPGRHEFKFLIDGEWCCEPGCDSRKADCEKCVPNSFGTMNRVIDIA